MSKSEDMRRLIDLANNNKIISESYSDNEADPFKAFSSWSNISEAGMPSSVIKSKEKIRYATDEENKQRFAGKTLEELRSMAWRHGYGKDSKEYDKFHDGVTGVPVTEDASPLSIEQLATISSEALDDAYHYGRSNPGNTFGWQANLKSAEYAKKIIDSGVTDIEQISDAIHKGWNVTAQEFVKNPNQFDDTENLKASGKLEAKLEQRGKLMNINYTQLPEDEKEKDRVVARALLQALTGQEITEDSDPCWDGYRQLGMKKKNGKKVPNCIPEGTLSEDEYGRDLGALYDRHVYGDDEDEDEEDEYYDYDDEDGIDFMQSGSALRAASHDNPRDQPCPTCDAPNKLTPADVELGYQCNDCADKFERGYD